MATLREVAESGSVHEMQERLGEWLGARSAVTEAALLAALVEPRYARLLAGARGFPKVVDKLLNAPPPLSRSAARMAGLARARVDKSAFALVRDAASSMLRWAAGGLTTVEESVRAKRFAACERCPHLSPPPDRAVYKAAEAVVDDARTCGLCGCIASAKARLPHERCPDSHPTASGLTRWGEPK